MASKSAIEWTDATWSVTSGCTKASVGCEHCFAERYAIRFHERQPRLNGVIKTHRNGVKGWSGVVRWHEDQLEVPLHWRKPRMIFVNSMSDLFHEEVLFEFIDQVYAVMNVTHAHVPLPPREPTPWHVYQMLTKRPEIAVEYYKSRDLNRFNAGEHPVMRAGRALMRGRGANLMNAAACLAWPPTNLWLGTSIETQDYMWRVGELCKCPAAVRFLSLEPLLGPIDGLEWYFRSMLWHGSPDKPEGTVSFVKQIHWVIVGGESGPGARPMHPDWVRSVRDQCVAAGVPFFFKGWGGVNKKLAGRLLDGRTWDEMPEGVAA